MALTNTQIVRLNTQDNTPGFYFLSDDEIDYLLTKESNNTDRASVEAARIILFKLSQNTDDTVDIFSIKGSKAAESYRQALMLYIKEPTLNPMYKNVKGYVGGVSLSDMSSNDANTDNNIIIKPTQEIPFHSIYSNNNSYPF